MIFCILDQAQHVVQVHKFGRALQVPVLKEVVQVVDRQDAWLLRQQMEVSEKLDKAVIVLNILQLNLL